MDHRITPSLRIGTSHGKLCVVGCMWKPPLYSPGCRLLIVYYFVRSSTSVIWFLHSNRLKKYSSLVQKTYPITHNITTFHWDDEYILKQPNQKIILNFFKRSSRLNGPFLLQQFLAISVAWVLSGILTASGAFPDDPTSDGFRARTDSKSGVLAESPFFYFPYPCTC